MAIFHMDIRPVARSRGEQATGAAAYIAGETIRDARTGEMHNHSRRRDVRHTEIILPSRFGKEPMAWARERVSLWNAAEAAEKRRNSRVARMYEVALPPEMSHEQRLALARSFSREIADRYGVAVDLAIHDPKPGPRESHNFHAHLLTTTRELTATALGAKAALELGAVDRAKQGLVSHQEEYCNLRERWATVTNQALRDANIDVRVDHRSLAAQGVDRKPLVHIPMEFYQLERQGVPKEAAERLREDYRARLAAYRERSAGSGRVEQPAADVQQPSAHVQEPSAHVQEPTSRPAREVLTPGIVKEARSQAAPQSEREAVTPRNAEEIRRQAIRAWLRMRSKGAESSAEPGTVAEKTSTRGTDTDRER